MKVNDGQREGEGVAGSGWRWAKGGMGTSVIVNNKNKVIKTTPPINLIPKANLFNFVVLYA